jgi:hypothetical protein
MISLKPTALGEAVPCDTHTHLDPRELDKIWRDSSLSSLESFHPGGNIECAEKEIHIPQFQSE